MTHAAQGLLMDLSRELVQLALEPLLEWTGVVAVPDCLPCAKGRGCSLPMGGNCQLDSYSCGAVAVAMIARYLNPDISFNEAWHAVRPTKTYGAGWGKVSQGLRHLGVRVSCRRDASFNQICSALKEGRPIATVVTTSNPLVNHWVVLYGYEKRPSRVLLANNGTLPLIRCGKIMTWRHFRSIWAEPGRALICDVR